MNGAMDKDKASEEKADMLGGAAKSPEAGALSTCPCLLRFIARGKVWRGNLFSCVLLSLAPVAGLLYVDALPEWLHQSACRAEPVRHGGSLLIAWILLSSLIYLLLRLGAVALKRVPSLRYVVAGGAGVVLLCPMLFSEESGLRMAAGLMAWGLLLCHLIRLSRGGYTEWHLWRDSRLSRILQALLFVGVMYLACTGRTSFLRSLIEPLSLLVLYLLSFCAQGPRGGVSFVRRVVFISVAAWLFPMLMGVMCMCSKGACLSDYAIPGLVPTAILLLYLLENRESPN